MTEITVGILGIGRLGEALAKAVLLHPGISSLRVSRRNAGRVENLVKQDSRVQPTDPEQMIDECDYVILALLPDVARQLLPTLKFEARHHIISAIAEISHTELQALTQGAGSVCRLLALPAIAGGQQTLPMYPQSASAELLFGQHNHLFPTSSEKEFLTLWSTTGILSAVMMVGKVAADWMAAAGIDPKRADSYARILFSEVYGATADGIDHGIEHVSTPGGLNAMTYQYLKDTGCEGHVRDNLQNIFNRLLANNKITPE